VTEPPHDPVFAAPWEAQAFGLAVTLHERGVFSWPEWSAALAAEIARDPGGDYYGHWLATLERFVVERELADAPSLARYARGWGRAAERTPHGTPIELRAEDLA
jgi:nitrile hydratase accessory protein